MATADLDMIYIQPGGSLIVAEKFVVQQGVTPGLDPSKAGQAGAAQTQKIAQIIGPAPFEGSFQGTATLPAVPPAGFFTTWFDANGLYCIMNSAGTVRKL